ncbi:hypothetical protein LOD99_10214 [Oopsacas minuta]|uniref:ACB domain-containing protein n=1 Tax=Oopsacas minuta TaxID=111878 RepID=A0AAV7KHL3_9METZ|nr:hypothetical protein LOD99_10214 [Oopsacas minuta]
MATAGDLAANFQKAADFIRSLPPEGSIQPSQELKLKYYSHYKQATIGKCDMPRPGMLDFTGKAKWDAWNALGDMSKDVAMREYIKIMVASMSENEKTPASEALLKELSEFLKV